MTDFYLSREQVRELDRRAVAEFGIPGIVLMENAGRGSAELLMRLNPDRQPTTILCGPGNNGGDGFVIARHLDTAGWPVTVWRGPGTLSGDAATNLRPLLAGRVSVTDSVTELPTGWIIDALFGTGLTRALGTPYSELVALVNASPNPVLAIDLPSGLDCDTGEPLGPTVRASHTATFVARKLGFRNPAAAAWTGTVHVVGIGAPRVLVDSYRTTA